MSKPQAPVGLHINDGYTELSQRCQIPTSSDDLKTEEEEPKTELLH